MGSSKSFQVQNGPRPWAVAQTFKRGDTATPKLRDAPTVDRQTHWSRRSLYDRLSELDVLDNTHIERSVGIVVSDVTGFVTSLADYATDRSVSLSGVWLLCFVVVNDRLLVAINDFIFLFLNVVLRRPIFRIYGFSLTGDVVANHKHQIWPHTWTLTNSAKCRSGHCGDDCLPVQGQQGCECLSAIRQQVEEHGHD
ncbi:Aste57867_1861 [Aphanomyces stellatus]|uniref:Aste57867_1861 protein n=1 Tax=Aphanomyces stellatus TaxID=120398 RepID=A0A485KBC7_9STRA|nr:hypothetical protein As57867_001859 [Aphanomyces stellatus]VFT79068.1 Aste57867_1861 [Aphanomyces stellatus]